MNSQRTLKLQKLATLVIIWTILGVFLTLFDHFILISHHSLGPSEHYSFWGNFTFNVLSGFFGGLIGGAYLIFVIDEKFRSEPYFKGIIAVFLGFLVIVTFFTLFSSTIEALLHSGESLFHPETKNLIKENVLNTEHAKNLLFWGMVVGLTQFMLLVSNKFGPGLLWSMVIGRYHFPKKEERIFMFLDLRSSTSIAERLGNEKYHALLKELFQDITDPILNCMGNIYQYVGDEVVISWDLPSGKDANNCIDCFFQIKDKLLSKEAFYREKFGTLPEFKAGIHFGKVIAGEIGIIKRDVTYSGDVLNTTARIQSQCNPHEVDFLCSKELSDLIKPGDSLQLQAIGAIPLRGKEEEVEVISIERV